MMNGTVYRRSRRFGFTLIEVLVVVAILAILSTIVAVGVKDHVKKARVAATRMNIKNIRTAIRAYEMDKGKLPESLNELVKPGDEKTDGQYLDSEEVPKDEWGHEFQLNIESSRFKIISAGPDGQFGSSDDIWE